MIKGDVVTYDRTFILQACHMNGGPIYDHYGLSLILAASGKWEEAYKYLSKVVPEVHGHNFRVRVAAKGTIGAEGYVIDDPLLEGILKRWDNVNLSTLEEFGPAGVRATTENMAKLLLGKISSKFTLVNCRVEVWETDSICAVAEY